MKTQLSVLAIILFCLFCEIGFSQPSIATKSIGTDSISGLQQQVSVYSLTINSKLRYIAVTYNIETLSPNGKIVATSQDMQYQRVNAQFDTLKASSAGLLIQGMINNDLAKWPNLNQ